MIKLRPHHLIDIIRNIGQDRPVIPHPYGHAQHTITQAILDGAEQEILITIGADDLCKPCIHISREGICDDVLPQLDDRTSKQTYNDELDARLLANLGLKNGSVILLKDFLQLIGKDIRKLTEICTHPKENENSRRMGMEKGVERLRRILE